MAWALRENENKFWVLGHIEIEGCLKGTGINSRERRRPNRVLHWRTVPNRTFCIEGSAEKLGEPNFVGEPSLAGLDLKVKIVG